MIIEQENRRITKSEEFKSSKHTISDAGAEYMFGLIRDSLYSDKIGSPLREVSINATDAHVEAGIEDTPIKITLPTRFDLSFTCRDFGSGLSTEDMYGLYSTAGESTKRESNRFAGHFGVGKFSPLGYSDSFTVTSFFGGFKSIFNILISEDGIGETVLMHKEQSSESSGLEVTIPVKSSDIWTFHEAAQKLFRFFKVKPIFTNADFELEESGELLVSGDCFKIYKDRSRTTSYAVMGNTGYPIDPESIKWTNEEQNSFLPDVLRIGAVLDFEIGELKVTGSRESLQYNEKTQRTISNKLIKVKEECLKETRKEIANCKSAFEVKCLLNKLRSGNYNYNRFFKFISDDEFHFNENRVKGDYWSTPESVNHQGVGVKEYSVQPATRRSSRNKVKAIRTCYSIAASASKAYVLNDLPKGNPISYVAPLCETDDNFLERKCSSVYVITITNQESWDKFVEENGFDAPLTKMSDLPKMTLRELGYVTSGSGTGSSNSKHTLKVLEFNPDFTSYSSTSSNFFRPTEVDMDEGGVFVKIDRFLVESPSVSVACPRRFQDVVASTCKEMGIDVPAIKAVKTKSIGKFVDNKKWIEIGDWIKKEVTCWLLRSDSAQVAIDRISFDSFRSSFRQPTNLDLLLRVNPIKKGAFEKWKASVIKMQGEGSRSSARAVKALIDSCKVDIELPDSSVDLANGWTALKEAYPMLPLVIGNYSYDSINYNKAVNDYVNLIDGNK